MNGRCQPSLWTFAVTGLLIIGMGGPALAKPKVSCGQIVAAMEEGNKSADEVATQLGVNARRVRKCMNPAAAKNTAGCDEILAALDGGKVSADKVATDLGVPAKRVRRCMKTATASP
jgi:predicted ArsR family transcriptional regulator